MWDFWVHQSYSSFTSDETMFDMIRLVKITYVHNSYLKILIIWSRKAKSKHLLEGLIINLYFCIRIWFLFLYCVYVDLHNLQLFHLEKTFLIWQLSLFLMFICVEETIFAPHLTAWCWLGKKKSCLVVLHRPPLIFENWKKVFNVQKYTAPNFQNSKKVYFSLRI